MEETNHPQDDKVKKKVIHSVFKKQSATLSNPLRPPRRKYNEGTFGTKPPTAPSRDTTIEILGARIEELLEFVKDKHNAHQNIKKLTNSIKIGQVKLQKDMENKSADESRTKS